ncbi:unnamed protein product [Rotaria sordida]|uniref:Uncharacterized protein n=1 Tax=Rotaria sordida TaxID=392033 RepID=A0A815WPJ5_9BILA|nr:unnamed protein product [Rotaria sordida]
MESATIEVRFKQTGETISVPVSSTSTMKDIIKYVCKESVCREEIDYNNYYLILLNNQEMLDDDKTFEEIQAISRENPDFQLCMKTAIREQIMRLARRYVRPGLVERVVYPQIPVDDAASRIIIESNENLQPSTHETDASHESNAVLCTTQSNTEGDSTPAISPTSSDTLKHYPMSELPKGFERWTQEDIRGSLEMILKKPKSDVLCMIYCASPSSSANTEQIKWLLKECMSKQIFCALVCTNKWAGSREQRDAVMKDFQRLLEDRHPKTREENDVIYFGNMGLCTAVNSERFIIQELNIILQPSGIDELILGIMQSLDDEKLAQWCMLAFENKSFWKNLFVSGKPIKRLWNKLLGKK